MSDVITGLRQVIQDLVAPDLKAVNAKADSLQKQFDSRFDAMQRQVDVKFEAQQKQFDSRFDAMQRQADAKFEAQQKQMDLQFDVLMKTIEAFRAELRSEFQMLRANNQIEVARQLAPLSERVAVLEARMD